MFNRLLTITALVLLLAGCGKSVTEIRGMKYETDQTKILPHIVELSKIIEEEKDEPGVVATALEISTYLATEKIDLASVNNLEFEVLVDNMDQLWKNPIVPEDKDDWTDKGYKIEETRHYLGALALGSLYKLEEKKVYSRSIEALKQMNPDNRDADAIRVVAMSGLKRNINRIKQQEDLKVETLAVLASIYRPDRSENSDFMKLFRYLEDAVTDLKTINTVIKRHRILFSKQESLTYVLNLNNRLWHRSVTKKFTPDAALVRENIDIMIGLANPYLSTDVSYLEMTGVDYLKSSQKRITGASKDKISSTNRALAKNTLTHFFPIPYIYKLFLTSRVDNNHLMKLLSFVPFLRNHQEHALKHKDSFYVPMIGKIFVNHHALYPTEYPISLDKLVQETVFGSIDDRVTKQSADFREKFFSLVFQVYTDDFADYLMAFLKNDFRRKAKRFSAQHITEMAIYAAQYAYLEEYDVQKLSRIYEAIFMLTTTQVEHFSSNDHKAYLKQVVPFLSHFFPQRHVKMCANVSQGFKNKKTGVKNIVLFTNHCLSSMEDPRSFEIDEKYWKAVGNVFHLHNQNITNTITGFLIERDIRLWVDLNLDIVFNSRSSNQSPNWYDYYLFGQIYRKFRSELPKSYDEKVVDVFIKGIDSRDDDISLSALRYAMVLSRECNVHKGKVTKAVKKRWRSFDIPKNYFSTF